ncbi:hypothetical protein DFH05DRAFT_317910 [Lentinula detonsa]|uniref:Uncharacterized protein n=1 Tax=Lentinula detonsa TaxID=2804962 RepID=A0A9W8NUW7_9AGAR|nr:hypothetical protein DFH05DRAFT_317910 [Lentinula detonsa]
MSAPIFAAQASLVLKSIPKIDKSHFISSFVDTQKQHAKYYAEEGRSLWNNLDDAHKSKPESPPPEEKVIGFSTPVLIPRNPKACESLTEKSTSRNPDTNVTERSPKKSRKANNAKSKPSRENIKNVQHTKKRMKKLFDDDGIAARLEERRDRKRTKREIMRPTANDNVNMDDNEDSKQIEATRGKKGKPKRSTSQTQNAPGLALMHGFTSTNVGKNRLTVPSPALGVFNRGRASTKTQVSKKPSQVVKPTTFQESVFLNGTTRRANPPGPKEPLSEKSTFSEGSSTPSTPPKPQTRKTRNSPVHTHTRSPAISSSSSSNDETELPIARAESELWDIEREGFHLPSSPERQKSVVLDVRGLQWETKTETVGEKQAVEAFPKSHEQYIASQPSSSLAPSQSASQHGLVGRTTNRISLLTSKYFVPQGPHPARAAPTLDEITLPFSAPPTPPLQARSPIRTCQNSVSEYLVDHSVHVAPNVQNSSPLYLPHQADEDHTADKPYIAPLYTLWNPLTFSDSVQISGTETTQPLFPETDPRNLVSSVSYPNHFYIPPRVDAPPLQNNFEYDAEGGSSFCFIDNDECSSMDWAGYDPEKCDFYDMSEEQEQGQQNDAEHEDLSDHHYSQHQLNEDNFDVVGNTEMALSGMDVEEDVMYRFPSEKWNEPVDKDRVTSEVDGEDLEVDEGMPRFLQGRELLLGLTATGRQVAVARDRSGYVSTAEADVAKSLSLKGHWLPQKL